MERARNADGAQRNMERQGFCFAYPKMVMAVGDDRTHPSGS